MFLKNFNISSVQAGPKKLYVKSFGFFGLPKLSDIKLFKIPAGKQIKIPNANTIAIVDLGSLNLSEIKKYNNIISDGTIVIASVYISHYIRLLLQLKQAFGLLKILVIICYYFRHH